MGDMHNSMIEQGQEGGRIVSASAPLNAVAEMEPNEFANILLEIQEQPSWRTTADIEADYYDGNQLDSETLAAMKELGMAPIIENLTAPTIDAVLGLEAKTRLDWKIATNADEDFSEVAEAMNYRMKQAESESMADRACSDSFAAQTKVGLGWVEVAREHNPFLYPYRVGYVPRNEIFWDFRGKRPDTLDWRYLVRKRWHDVDVIEKTFPDKADMLRLSCAGWSGMDPTMLIDGGRSTGLAMDYGRERGWTHEEQEWRDTFRRRLCLSEVWYRRWIRGHVLKTPDGRVIEFDRKNRDHIEAVAYNLVQVRSALYTKVRLAWFVGPHKLADMPTPYKHDKFPYVPFFGKREDMTGVPYGLIRGMKPLQDEINARNTKMIWLLAAKRVTMTEGVTKDSPETVRREAARPDAMHVLDAQKLAQGGKFEVETDFQLNSQQYSALVDKRQALKNVAGVYASFEGNQKGAISGVAANTLVEQSTQTLAEIFDNYQFARRQVGDLLMSLIIEDIGDKPMEVKIDNEVNGAKTVKLNVPDERGLLTNDVQRARLKVALSDVPGTASYREQRFLRLTELTRSLPENLQALVIDFVMAASDDPQRGEIVKRLRKALNLGDQEAPKTPEEEEAQLAAKEEQAQAAALQQRAIELDLAGKEADNAKKNADAQKVFVEVAQMQQQMDASMSGASPREQELAAQIQQIIQQATAEREAVQQKVAQMQAEYESNLSEVNDALASATLAAENKKADSESAVRIAEIQADAAIRTAEAEAAAQGEQLRTDLGKQMKAFGDQIAAVMTELSSIKNQRQEKEEVVVPNITIPITIERSSESKTGVMKKNKDGSYEMQVQSNEKDKE